MISRLRPTLKILATKSAKIWKNSKNPKKEKPDWGTCNWSMNYIVQGFFTPNCTLKPINMAFIEPPQLFHLDFGIFNKYVHQSLTGAHESPTQYFGGHICGKYENLDQIFVVNFTTS